MPGLFYVSAAVAILATLLALTRSDVVHGLLYLVVSLLAVAMVFFALGAPFMAALEVIIYAGAIVVLFIFVVMMLGLGGQQRAIDRGWWRSVTWLGPVLLGAILVAELMGLFVREPLPALSGEVSPGQVGVALYGPYLVGVELASMLLLGALVGAHHLGRRRRPGEEEEHDGGTSLGARSDPGCDPLRAGLGRPAGTPQLDVHPDGP